MDREPARASQGVADGLYRLCRVASAELVLSGAAVTLKSADGSEAIAAASDPASQMLAELEFSVGEGPARDAFARGRPVLVPDLERCVDGSWPGYAPVARAAGIGAAFAFPLQTAHSRFGVLSVFAATSRHLGHDETMKLLTLTGLATEMLLESSAGTADGEIDPGLKNALAFRSEIYQAQGMVMAALRVPLAEALARMRAHAFLSGRDLLEVALDIVAGRLHLTNDRPD